MAIGTGRKLQRNLSRRRLGGVCAGLADYLGIRVTWVRLAVLVSVFFSFSLTLWIYLALWLLVPAKADVPIPAVSRGLRRELYKLDRQVRKAHRRLDAAVADQAQSAFDALKLLTAQVEFSEVPVPVRELWKSARQRMPRLVEQLLIMPEAFAAYQGERGRENAYGRLLAELAGLDAELRQALSAVLEREFTGAGAETETETPEVRAWKKQLAPLNERLRARADADTLVLLQQIEAKLAFLLHRSGSNGGPFDLGPFQVRQIAFEYLPDAIHEYLQLPPDMSRTLRLSGGKTAEESLDEQLRLLDNALEELARSLFQHDAQGLLIHGRFLKEKFADQPFRLSE